MSDPVLFIVWAFIMPFCSGKANPEDVYENNLKLYREERHFSASGQEKKQQGQVACKEREGRRGL